jgi:hypothetical protein
LLGFVKIYDEAETKVGLLGVTCNGKAVTTRDLKYIVASAEVEEEAEGEFEDGAHINN